MRAQVSCEPTPHEEILREHLSAEGGSKATSLSAERRSARLPRARRDEPEGTKQARRRLLLFVRSPW